MKNITNPVHATTKRTKMERHCRKYLGLWNLLNCIGSRDGKHIRTKCLPITGSLYYNYKGYFSVILPACADADAQFTTVHVGDFGKNSDGSVFRSLTSEKCWRKKNCTSHFQLPYHWMTGAKYFPATS
jgi:hypothetical protein